jgi:hypothetical protein
MECQPPAFGLKKLTPQREGRSPNSPSPISWASLQTSRGPFPLGVASWREVISVWGTQVLTGRREHRK